MTALERLWDETSDGFYSYCKVLEFVNPPVVLAAANLLQIYMSNTSVQPGSSPAAKSVIARFIGIITAPKATFESVVASPKWLGMLVLTTLISAGGAALPMTTEGGRDALLDQQVRTMEGFGMQVNDQTYEQLRKRNAIAPYTTAGSIIVMSPIITAVIAGILFAIFNAAMGGNATFKQVYAVVVHAGVIQALGQLFTGPLNFFRQSMTSATSLAVLLPMLPDGSFAARLAGMIDLFLVWWVVALSIGLAVLFRRRTQPIAISLFAVYAVIALGAAAIMSRLGGTH
jgi:Yip1 domain